MIVVDAAAMIEVLLHTSAALGVERRIYERGEVVCAPHLLDLEVASVLRRLVRSGEVSQDQAGAAMDALGRFPLRRHAHRPLFRRVWALRDNLSAYDAAYVALAEALDAPLVTCYGRLAAAPGHHARIELV